MISKCKKDFFEKKPNFIRLNNIIINIDKIIAFYLHITKSSRTEKHFFKEDKIHKIIEKKLEIVCNEKSFTISDETESVDLFNVLNNVLLNPIGENENASNKL